MKAKNNRKRNIVELKPSDNILISRTDKLGDLVLSLPFVETIKNRYPECRVDVLTSLYASPILENNDRIDRIVRVQNDQLIKDPLYKKDLLHKIKLGSYKVVVALYPERIVSQLFYKAGIPIRIGTGRRFHSVFYNNHIFHSRKENKKHERDYNLDFLEFFRDGETVMSPRVYPKAKEIRYAHRILNEMNVTGNFVTLHPGSGGSAERWSLDRFIRLYKLLVDAGLPVVLSGSEAEGRLIESRSRMLGIDAKQITGETDLRTLAAVLSISDVVVANSTGPLHLAVAVGTKVVGLYSGKKVMSPVRWGPLGEDHRVLLPEKQVCECPPRQCRCMETISEERVAEEVIALYRLKSKVVINQT